MNYTDIEEFYASHPESKRFKTRCGQLEFLTTLHYLEKYIEPGMRILEIGAGTGEYSLYFSKHGYEVDSVELLEHNIELFRESVTATDKIRIYQGNATNLSMLEANSYDITLLLGPMYHLIMVEEQITALSEAVRVTKPNGLLFVAYCMQDAVIIRHGFMKQDICFPKRTDFSAFKCKSKKPNVIELHTRPEIDVLVGHFPVSRLHFVGTDMLGVYFGEALETMPVALFDQFLQYHYSICERADLVGITGHSLDILRKSR